MPPFSFSICLTFQKILGIIIIENEVKLLDICGKCLTRQFYIQMEGVISMAKTNKLFQVAARITEEEKDALVAYCDENDLSMSQVIRKAIKEFISRQD